MIARTIARRRYERFHYALQNELVKVICVHLIASPELIEPIANGQEPPDVWTEPFEAHFPAPLIRELRKEAVIFSRRLAGILIRSRYFRDRMNRKIELAESEEGAARALRDAAAAALRELTKLLPQGVFDLESCLNEMRLHRRRKRCELIVAGLWYAAAGAGLAGEVVTIAAVGFQLLDEPDPAQQIATWSGAIATAVALTFAGEKGLRPLLNPAERASLDAAGRRTVAGAVGLMLVLSTLVGLVRASGTGEGGASDAVQFLLAFIATPFLALVAGHCIAAGEHHRAKANAANERLAELDEARVRIEALGRRRDAEAHQRAADQIEADRIADAADRRAAEEAMEKQQLIRDAVRAVLGSPDVKTMIAKLARDAAELSLPIEPKPPSSNGRPPKVSAGLVNVLALTLVLPVLSGCSREVRATFGAGTARVGVAEVLDLTRSNTDLPALIEEARADFQGFLREPAGSKFEFWVTSLTPGDPKLLHEYTNPHLPPRERKQARDAAAQEFNAKLDKLRPGKGWSSVLEDSYRAADRLSTHQVESRKLVLLSDLQQYSPFLTVSQILRQRESGAVVKRALGSYPPLRVPPDTTELVYLRGHIIGGGTLPPDSYDRLKRFWQDLWKAWGAKRVDAHEPSTLTL